MFRVLFRSFIICDRLSKARCLRKIAHRVRAISRVSKLSSLPSLVSPDSSPSASSVHLSDECVLSSLCACIETSSFYRLKYPWRPACDDDMTLRKPSTPAHTPRPNMRHCTRRTSHKHNINNNIPLSSHATCDGMITVMSCHAMLTEPLRPTTTLSVLDLPPRKRRECPFFAFAALSRSIGPLRSLPHTSTAAPASSSRVRTASRE